ncbi:diaminopimelate epimerase [Bartonella sp. DGB2]|uniref:diaminopimelate epimerase n=1 Tax=Bartonella sp. DGB2 TaxID=3388426 RepID=UPI0039901A2A
MIKEMIAFSKMHGLGNKIIVADMGENSAVFHPQAITQLAQDSMMHFDQIMAIYPANDPKADYALSIYNIDGSLAQACGNGTRCVVEWLYQQNRGEVFTFQTQAGLLHAMRTPTGLVSVDMGAPRFLWQEIPLSQACDTVHAPIGAGPLSDATLVSMGNPHAIYFLDQPIDDFPLDTYGPLIEHHPFFPERCNVSIVSKSSETTLHMRTWERGAGLTKACGSAACAAVVSAHRRGLLEPSSRDSGVDVYFATHRGWMETGMFLSILWKNDQHVCMIGPTSLEFSGQLNPQTGDYYISENKDAS